jgi:4-alpha-glucanotransferase
MPNSTPKPVVNPTMTNAETSPEALPVGREVQELLDLHGIQASYLDYAGEQVQIPHSNRLAVLGLMGVELTAASNVAALLQCCRQKVAGHWLPPATVVPCEREASVALRIPVTELETPCNWLIRTEAGSQITGAFIPEQLSESVGQVKLSGPDCGRLLVLPPLPAGYHTLSIRHAGRQREFNLIAAPDRGFIPSWAESGKKLAGISLHLYELRSSRNWGIGDFTDLLEFAGHAADCGLDFVVLNPLHILDGLSPGQCSPYSPLDRRFLNPLYIDVEKEPDFHDNPAIVDYVARPAFQERLQELREAELVDYDSIDHIKHVVLSKMFKQFKRQHLDQSSERAAAFTGWLAKKGTALQKFGEFQAARHRLTTSMARHREFHYYLQWLAEDQLRRCQNAARSKGMSIGLVRDLAVGSARDGAEVQLNPDLFCAAASVGAPPDPLAPQGQNWGLPPMNPLALKNSGFAHFIELLKDNMAHCGALRIDHVMSLMRLWWCPGQDHSGTGAYVSYPANELFAILRLESQRQQCTIIGEDLGIVPPEIRQLMTNSGFFSNLLLYFEKYDPVRFRHPADWTRSALAMVANHDVPTLAAWWSKSDLALRYEIGLFDCPDQLNAAVGARESDLIQILHWLNELHLLPGNWKDFNIHRQFDTSLCEAILTAVAMSEARLVSLQPEDLCLTQKPINIPGTGDEYPNWKQKLPVSVDELFDEPKRRHLLQAFVDSRGEA